MPIRKIESVRKRDDSVVSYDEQKIAEAIARAARSAGQDNGAIGRDLAGVVTTYLERYRDHDIGRVLELFGLNPLDGCRPAD